MAKRTLNLTVDEDVYETLKAVKRDTGAPASFILNSLVRSWMNTFKEDNSNISYEIVKTVHSMMRENIEKMREDMEDPEKG